MAEERLKELFLGWTVLDAEEKEMIDELIYQSEKLHFYKPLMDALRQWELVQDTQENILEKIHQENRASVSSDNVCCSSSVANDLSDDLTPERTQSDGVIVEEIHHQLISNQSRTIMRSYSLDGLCSCKH